MNIFQQQLINILSFLKKQNHKKMRPKMSLTKAVAKAPLYRAAGFPPQDNPKVAIIIHAKDLGEIKNIVTAFNAKKFSVEYIAIPNYDATLPGEANINGRVIPVGPSTRLLNDFCHLERCAYFPLRSIFLSVKLLAAQGILFYYRIDDEINKISRRNETYLTANQARFEKLYASLADRHSRRVLASRIKAFITGNNGYHLLSPYPEYAPPCFSYKPGSVFIDAGVDHHIEPTIMFSEWAGNEGSVWSLEPDPQSLEWLEESLQPYKNVHLLPVGLLDKQCEVKFVQAGGGSHVLRKGEDDQKAIVCQMEKLDSIIQKNAISRVDMIKMDIEGAELQALYGARETITKFIPDMAICIYHKADTEFLDIFEFIDKLGLGYTFYLGHHGPGMDECVLYAKRP